jgi:hypothetical protein
MRAVREFNRSDVVAALTIGSIGLLMLGAQPVVLGELVERKVISLEGVGIVAMGEIIAIGVGVALGDALLATTRMRFVAIVAALITALFDFGSLAMSSDAAFVVERALAGLGEGVMMWATTCVIVRSSAPERLAGAFLVAQTLAQAAVAAVLATVIVPRFGWQGAFAALGVLSAAAALVAPLLPASLDPLKAEGAPRLGVSPAVVLTLAVIFCEMATLGALWAFLEPLGTRAGLDSQTAQTIVSGVLVMQVIGGLTATALAERLPPGRTLAVAAAILACDRTCAGSGADPLRRAVRRLRLRLAVHDAVPHRPGAARRPGRTGRDVGAGGATHRQRVRPARRFADRRRRRRRPGAVRQRLFRAGRARWTRRAGADGRAARGRGGGRFGGG